MKTIRTSLKRPDLAEQLFGWCSLWLRRSASCGHVFYLLYSRNLAESKKTTKKKQVQDQRGLTRQPKNNGYPELEGLPCCDSVEQKQTKKPRSAPQLSYGTYERYSKRLRPDSRHTKTNDMFWLYLNQLLLHFTITFAIHHSKMPPIT